MIPVVCDTGFTVVVPQPHETHLADVIIIHGLHGHPLKTWLYSDAPTRNPRSFLARLGVSRKGKDKSKMIASGGNDDSFQPATASDRSSQEPSVSTVQEKSTIYWPTDLLPAQCPGARILVYGYETKTIRGLLRATNKTGIFALGQDFLYDLQRERSGGPRKPIIFVAHSLGGVLVKEMLSSAVVESEETPGFSGIVEDTKAILFLGTPHRGSDTADLGTIARRIVSAFGVDTNRKLLDSLGLRNEDLDRNHKSFTNIWDKRRFRVKTFQESRGLTGVNIGPLNKLIVPAYSSSLGYVGEHPETLAADHISMCKYQGPQDPNYRKFGGEMAQVYQLVTQLDPNDTTRVSATLYDLELQPSWNETHTVKTEALASLTSAHMGIVRGDIEHPAPQTCRWPAKNQEYHGWLSRSTLDKHHGLIRITGHPGSGKSVLVKSLASTCQHRLEHSPGHLATFYFNARSHFTESKSMTGLLRALLFQLLPICEKTFSKFCTAYRLKQRSTSQLLSDIKWDKAELQQFLVQLCSEPRDDPVYIFIDALDECGLQEDSEDSARSVALFMRNITDIAYDAHANINVCMSCRRHPTISIRDCPEILLDLLNHEDIGHYVNRKITQSGMERSAAAVLEIQRRANGIFLWARIALSLIVAAVDDGYKPTISSILREVPDELEQLYERILGTFSPPEHQRSMHLFQWALFSQRPLSTTEWYHVLALIDLTDLRSLKAWKTSEHGIDNDQQLSKRIRSMSGGLLEVTLPSKSWESAKSLAAVSTGPPSVSSCYATSKATAAAGSMASFGGEVPVVQFIHESVREYFLHGNGFELLGKLGPLDLVGASHIYIMTSCLRYTLIEELDGLIHSGRTSAAGPPTPPPIATSDHVEHFTRHHNTSGANVSIASFGSSASYSIRRVKGLGGQIHSGQASAARPPSLAASDHVEHFTRHHNASGTNLSIASFSSSASYSIRRVNVLGGSKSSNPVNSGPRLYAKILAWLETAGQPETPASEAGCETIANIEPVGLEVKDGSESPVNMDLIGENAPESELFDFDDYPYLRLYVIDMFVHHAAAADAAGADHSGLMDMIGEAWEHENTSNCWYRWCHLNEGISSHTAPAQFAADYGIIGWTKWYTWRWIQNLQ